MPKKASSKQSLLLLLMTCIAALMLFPLLWMLVGSLEPQQEIFSTDPTLLPRHLTLSNYALVFTQTEFYRYMWNSFVVASSVTIMALLFHAMAGYSLARLRYPGRDIIFFLIVSTLFISFPVVLVPLFIIVKSFGWVNTWAGLIFPVTFNAFGIFVLRQFYLGLPRELEEAATMDGYAHWRIFSSIALPLSKPILSALAVFFFLYNWNNFIWPLIVTTNSNKWLVQVAIANFASEYGASWNLILAGSVVAALPTLLLFLIFQRQLIEGISVSGLKL